MIIESQRDSGNRRFVALGTWRRAWRNRANGEQDTKYEEHWLEATENVKGFALSLRAVANDVRKY